MYGSEGWWLQIHLPLLRGMLEPLKSTFRKCKNKTYIVHTINYKITTCINSDEGEIFNIGGVFLYLTEPNPLQGPNPYSVSLLFAIDPPVPSLDYTITYSAHVKKIWIVFGMMNNKCTCISLGHPSPVWHGLERRRWERLLLMGARAPLIIGSDNGVSGVG